MPYLHFQKFLILLVLIVLGSTLCRAQDIPDLMDDKKITKVEQMPMFPGCEHISDYMERKTCAEKRMLEFIYTNITYPEEAQKNGIEGMVVISFIVDRDGTLTDLKILRNLGGGCGAEAIRVIQSSPKWNPGIQRGEPVKVQFNLPIRFKLESNNEKKKKKKKKRRRG